MGYKRILRDLKAMIQYPIWSLKKEGPDNHYYKVNRIRKIAKNYKCTDFIETGTFYGQTIWKVKDIFSKVFSVEFYEPLYLYNIEQFKDNKNVKIFYGDSSVKLSEMVAQTNGKILFWLDGHYSGEGTGLSKKTSPIIEELDVIKASLKNDCCIVIDDKRLFNGTDGYPTYDETINKLKGINPNFNLVQDGDAIIALI